MCVCFLHAVYVRMCVHVCVYVYVCCSRAAPGFMLAAWVGLVAGGELSFVSVSFWGIDCFIELYGKCLLKWSGGIPAQRAFEFHFQDLFQQSSFQFILVTPRLTLASVWLHLDPFCSIFVHF